MRISAFAPTLDFSKPDPIDEIEEEVEDHRIEPEEVERLVEAARQEARAAGYDEGFAAGQEQERGEIATRIEEQVSELLSALAELRANEEALFTDLETRTSRLMLALVHQLAKRLSDAEANRLAQNVTMRAVEAVRGKHRMTIRAPEEYMDALRAVLRLPTDQDAEAHRIVFEVAEGDGQAPLEVAWLTGKVTFDPYAFKGAIDDVFRETLESLDGEGTPSP